MGQNRIDILTKLTYFCYNSGKINEAEKYNSQIFKLSPAENFAMYNLGAICIEKDDTVKAQKIWKDIVLKYPNSEVAG